MTNDAFTTELTILTKGGKLPIDDDMVTQARAYADLVEARNEEGTEIITCSRNCDNPEGCKYPCIHKRLYLDNPRNRRLAAMDPKDAAAELRDMFGLVAPSDMAGEIAGELRLEPTAAKRIAAAMFDMTVEQYDAFCRGRRTGRRVDRAHGGGTMMPRTQVEEIIGFDPERVN